MRLPFKKTFFGASMHPAELYSAFTHVLFTRHPAYISEMDTRNFLFTSKSCKELVPLYPIPKSNNHFTHFIPSPNQITIFLHIKIGLGVSFHHQEREQRNSAKIPSPSRSKFCFPFWVLASTFPSNTFS